MIRDKIEYFKKCLPLWQVGTVLIALRVTSSFSNLVSYLEKLNGKKGAVRIPHSACFLNLMKKIPFWTMVFILISMRISDSKSLPLRKWYVPSI